VAVLELVLRQPAVVLVVAVRVGTLLVQAQQTKGSLAEVQ
jgi:hypothetical protein